MVPRIHFERLELEFQTLPKRILAENNPTEINRYNSSYIPKQSLGMGRPRLGFSNGSCATNVRTPFTWTSVVRTKLTAPLKLSTKNSEFRSSLFSSFFRLWRSCDASRTRQRQRRQHFLQFYSIRKQRTLLKKCAQTLVKHSTNFWSVMTQKLSTKSSSTERKVLKTLEWKAWWQKNNV